MSIIETIGNNRRFSEEPTAPDDLSAIIADFSHLTVPLYSVDCRVKEIPFQQIFQIPGNLPLPSGLVWAIRPGWKEARIDFATKMIGILAGHDIQTDTLMSQRQPGFNPEKVDPRFTATTIFAQNIPPWCREIAWDNFSSGHQLPEKHYQKLRQIFADIAADTTGRNRPN